MVVAFGLVLYLAISHSPRTPLRDNQVALKPTGSTYTGVNDHDDHPQADLVVTDPDGNSYAISMYAGGVPYESRKQDARDNPTNSATAASR